MTNPEELKQALVFRNLDQAQLEVLAERGERRVLAQGELVFEEGSAGDEVFVVLEGRVQCTVKMSRDSEQAPVHTVVPGEIVGEFALVADHRRSATVRATQDSVLFVLRRSAFRKLAEEDPRLGYVVLRDMGEILVERIIKTTQELRASLMF
jgi:CRP-like cAMP-binding protein